jgi:hypothetical protein
MWPTSTNTLRNIVQVKEALDRASSRVRLREETLFAPPDLGLISSTYHFATMPADDNPEPVAPLYRRAADYR